MADVLAPNPAVSRAIRPHGAGPAGQGELAIERSADGRSVVTRALATSPLRLLTPQNHGRAAWVYTSSLGGGLVDGDRIGLDVDIGPGAAAFLSTQASTKVYRSAGGTSTAVHGRVAAHGLLALVPDPVVCFAGATYRQVQSFDIATSGGLVLVDWLSSGRHAAGERWAFDEYAARLQLRVDGAIVLHDALALRAGDGDLRARLGRFDVVATVAIVGPQLRAAAAAVAERVAAIAVDRRMAQLIAAAPLGAHGWLVRLAGTSFEQTAALVRDYLGFLPPLLGDDPWARKW